MITRSLITITAYESLIPRRRPQELQLPVPREEIRQFELRLARLVGERLNPMIRLRACGSYRRGAATTTDIDIFTWVEGDEEGSYHTHVLEELLPLLRSEQIVVEDLSSNFLKPIGVDVHKSYMGIVRAAPLLPHRRIDIKVLHEPQHACNF